jgi:hypothetical protein
MKDEPHFVYVRHNGIISPEKWYARTLCNLPAHQELERQYVVAKFKITDEEFERDDLRTLAARYPLPGE